MNIPSGTFYRSRAMPMRKDEDNGSEKNCSWSDDYCCSCYHGGKFINPGITSKLE
jgi:hypothetical protein